MRMTRQHRLNIAIPEEMWEQIEYLKQQEKYAPFSTQAIILQMFQLGMRTIITESKRDFSEDLVIGGCYREA